MSSRSAFLRTTRIGWREAVIRGLDPFLEKVGLFSSLGDALFRVADKKGKRNFRNKKERQKKKELEKKKYIIKKNSKKKKR